MKHAGTEDRKDKGNVTCTKASTQENSAGQRDTEHSDPDEPAN